MERPKISEALVLYSEFQRARGMAEGTIRARTQAVRSLVKVTGDIQVESLTPRHLERVFTSYSWAPTTSNVILSIYRNFFAWCRARRFMSRENDPLLGWRSRKVPDVDRTRIPVQSWPALFEACRSPHERIVLATGLYLFLRVSEQQALQLGDIDLQNSTIEIYRRKTKERDTMPIPLELEVHLREHLTWMASLGFTDPSHYLIPTRKSNLERDELQRWIPGSGDYDPTRPLSHLHRYSQRVLDRAGFERLKGEGGHLLRRSGARAYFDSLVGQGYDGALRRVQAMLGHKSGVMTEIYLGLNLDREARNQALAGRLMFPELVGGNVSQLRRVE